SAAVTTRAGPMAYPPGTIKWPSQRCGRGSGGDFSRMNPSKKALAADLLAAALLAAGTISLFSNDLSLRIAGIRISMRTSWRPFVLAIIVLAVRNWLVRRPPSFAWVIAPFRRFSLARLAREAGDPLPLDEDALFETTTAREFALLLVGFSALTIALTW